MDALLEWLLPVGTLVLGGLLTRWHSRGDARIAARREADELLAEMPKFVWSRGEDGAWLEFQVYLGRVSAKLRAAGVPESRIRTLREAAVSFWRAVEESGDPDIGRYLQGDQDVALARAEADVADWLHRPWLRRLRLRRHTNRLE